MGFKKHLSCVIVQLRFFNNGWFVGCGLKVLGKLVRVYADADLEPGKKTTLYIHSTQ